MNFQPEAEADKVSNMRFCKQPSFAILIMTLTSVVSFRNVESIQYLPLNPNESSTGINLSHRIHVDKATYSPQIQNETDSNITCLPTKAPLKVGPDKYNCTSLEHAPQLTGPTVVRVIVLSFIATTSLIGNVAVLVSIRRSSTRKRSTVYFLIGHLAFADLFVTQFCVIAEAAWTYTIQWLAGSWGCKLIKFMQMFSLYLSTFLLVVIGYDRFMAIKYPMKRVDAKGRVTRMVYAAWILSLVLSSPQIVIFSVVRGPFVEEFYQCVTYEFYTADWQEQVYTSITLVLMFLLPLCILMFTYICTFYTIAKKEHRFSDRPKSVMDEARRKLLRKAKMKALMITVVIVMAFVICWTPYYCMMVIFIFLEPDERLSEELMQAIFFFGSSTAMINPIIYGAFHLRRQPRKNRAHNSSGSSRCEKTVMLVTFKKTRVNLHKVCHDSNAFQAECSNGECSRTVMQRDISCSHSLNSKNANSLKVQRSF